ncbi:T6SS effector amidase Tae4 family protein [Psychrobacter sp. B38]|uniref:T6SS effector amidase Tae4 family protein n=1 Tax=Psychrobacter sp. B38 TaxID=3143538 RepID=UPI00320CA5F3
MPRTPNERQSNPFAVFGTSNASTEDLQHAARIPSDRMSSTRSQEIQQLTKTTISRFRKCHCKLPYADDFKKHYLFYDSYTGAQAWEKIGGNIGNGYGINHPNGVQNSCAARVSYGLNKAGKLIPKSAPSANLNIKEGKRYIIDAGEMNKYLKTLAKPDYTLTNSTDFYKLKSALTHEDVFIMAKKGHVTVVTMNYQDRYATSYLGDVWLLPTRKCKCE